MMTNKKAGELVTIGKGMTAENRRLFTGDQIGPGILAALSAARRRYQEGGGIFAGDTLEYEKRCLEILQKAGEEPYAARSDAALAKEFLWHRSAVKKLLEQGDAYAVDEAAALAFQAGKIVTTLAMKLRWQADVDANEDKKAKSRFGLIEANKKKKAEHDKKTRRNKRIAKIASECLKMNPRLKRHSLAEAISVKIKKPKSRFTKEDKALSIRQLERILEAAALPPAV